MRIRRRGWKREPVYLNFAYYLLKQGGKFKNNSEGDLCYRFERELSLLLRRLGLLERYKRKSKDALTVLERTFDIYSDIDYLSDYEWLPAKKGLKQKVLLELNRDSFPHLQSSSNLAESMTRRA